jgi:hypothetical protein
VSGNNCSEYSTAYWHGTFQPNIRANLDWFVTIRNWLGIVLHMLCKWVICHKPFPLLNGVLASIFVLKVVLLSLENILVEWFNFVCSYLYPILPYVFITSRVPIIATLYHYSLPWYQTYYCKYSTQQLLNKQHYCWKEISECHGLVLSLVWSLSDMDNKMQKTNW